MSASGPKPWRLDLALGAGCALLVEGDVAVGEVTPKVPLALAVLLLALGAVASRRLPGPAALAGAVGWLAAGLLTTSQYGPQWTVVPLLGLLFAAAVSLSGRPAAGYGSATLVLVVVGHAVSPEGDALDFWPWMLWAGAWGSGTLVRRRTETARREAVRAALLEAQATSSAADAAAQERDRIARELHDVVAHAVSLMVVQAGAERLRLRVYGDAGATETMRALSSIEEAGRDALAELRTLLGLLSEDGAAEDADPLPRLSAVHPLVDRLRASGLPVDLVLEPADVLEHGGQLPGAVELAAYRIVQEGLTNVVRHAGLVTTTVRVRQDHGHLVVDIESAAPTRHASSPGAGRGVAGMRVRAAAVGGTVEAGRCGDGGFAVHAELPLGARPAVGAT